MVIFMIVKAIRSFGGGPGADRNQGIITTNPCLPDPEAAASV
jgi:hypothetical protein